MIKSKLENDGVINVPIKADHEIIQGLGVDHPVKLENTEILTNNTGNYIWYVP